MNDLSQCEVVSVRKLENDGNLKAFIDIRLGGTLVIRGCTVMEGKNGRFASLPRRIDRAGKWSDIVIAADDKLRDRYKQIILDAFDEEAGE